MLRARKPLIADLDAVRIGDRYEQGSKALADYLRSRWDCGVWLAAKRKSLGYGKWYPWLDANQTVLSFGRETARKLIKFAEENPTLAWDLAEDEYIELSRQLWGHDVDSRWKHKSGYWEWYTPTPIVEAAREAMGGIDLDPASCVEANDKTVKATTFYTMEEDGLKQPWSGRVFLNPPFKADIIKAFSKKLISAYESHEIEQAVFLCNAGTETQWWHNVLKSSGLVCLPRGRVKFWGPKKGNPGHLGQSLFYFGLRPSSPEAGSDELCSSACPGALCGLTIMHCPLITSQLLP